MKRTTREWVKKAEQVQKSARAFSVAVPAVAPICVLDAWSRFPFARPAAASRAAAFPGVVCPAVAFLAAVCPAAAFPGVVCPAAAFLPAVSPWAGFPAGSGVAAAPLAARAALAP